MTERASDVPFAADPPCAAAVCSVPVRPGCCACRQCRSTGRCISWYFVCDGRRHCEDGSDELLCRPTPGALAGALAPGALAGALAGAGCPPLTHTCASGGQCVSRAHLCDGQRHCDDGSDERGCRTDAESLVNLLLPQNGQWSGSELRRRPGRRCGDGTTAARREI